ncbi:EAL domain-containing protein [Anaerovorax odorimutans]|uniref:Stage 0 sporulation protein A homolog n=1 Tax=Anaerovorax odorimutans TaxID=109327 RepID=A0ABT1RLI1_9FIRM|nr:EAL domain-containing protein [Anaerovorax odorimutans]MCQ4635801.1 EAL domain-containing protein [Anaerovorax odorimutans]
MRKHIVLVLESRKEDNDRLKEYLEEQYIVIQAFNEQEALQAMTRCRGNIEVALVDQALLTMSGNKIMDAVKEKILSDDIPAIAVLKEYDLTVAAGAIKAGAAEIIIRPYEKNLLRRRVHNMILRNELKLARQYDSLTGIYNKETFYKKAESLIRRHPEQDYTIVCLDIDRFKLVNDLYGTREGDRLLQFVGNHLKVGTAEAGGVVGRLVADVFVGCYPNIGEQYAYVAERITQMFKSYPLPMELVAAIGFYQVEDPALPASRMCDRAILALNSVKNNYLVNYAVYNESLRDNLMLEQEIVNDMDFALKNGEFKVYIQPKCDMDTGRIVGGEALVRWIHPEKGMVSPGDFVPIFEKNKFILKLDYFVWEEVCKVMRRWIDEGGRPIPISVNVSRINLYNDDLYEQIVSLVEKYQIDPKLFQLEITESAYSSNIEYLTEVVARLQAYGFTILMDDFGSGYSSLNMLKDISVDILKLDMRFLTGETNGHGKGGDIMESVVRMAKWINLYVIAEGVETREQVEFLLSINCHYAQGYYYYRPMPMEEFKELMRDGEKVDYRGMRRKMGETFNLQELMQPDVMSNVLLQNIIGGVAFYEYYKGNLELIRVNEGYYAETGCSEEELQNYAKHISDMVYEEDRGILDRLLKEAAEYPESGVEEVLRRRRCGGGTLWIRMKLFFLAENKGRQIFYASLRNVTEEKEAEEQLRISEERLRLAMQGTSSVLFDLDIKKRTSDCSEDSARKFGMPPHLENVPDCIIQQKMVHPDHIDPFVRMYQDIFNGKPRAICEARLMSSDGSYHWNRVTLTSVCDKDGHPIRAVGVVENLDREKELEAKLKGKAENDSA